MNPPHVWSKGTENCGQKMNHDDFFWEICKCIKTGSIYWFNGLSLCGIITDIYIFGYKLKHKLIPEDRVLVDDGYRGYPKFLDPN